MSFTTTGNVPWDMPLLGYRAPGWHKEINIGNKQLKKICETIIACAMEPVELPIEDFYQINLTICNLFLDILWFYCY